jgi:regulator of RNase E activity RraA
VTVKRQAGPLEGFKREEFAVGQMIDAVGTGQVLVIDVGGAEVSTFGGLASLAAKVKGVEAVVILMAHAEISKKLGKQACGWPAAM